MRWTRKNIVAEIKQLHARGSELNYAAVETNNLNLVRAAAWHFGTWQNAVEAAGIVYDNICKYRRWDPERIVARIRELHAQNADLSWRSVSTEVDPPLAAAALRPNGFRSWREAIAAAGLDIESVARYQAWSETRVLREIKALRRERMPLSSKAVQSTNQPLFCAARRRFGSWDAALARAGLSAEKIRLRRPAGATPAAPGKVPAAAKGVAAKATAAKATAAKATAAKATAAKATAAKATAAKATAARGAAVKGAAAKAVAARPVATKTASAPAAAPQRPTSRAAKPAVKTVPAATKASPAGRGMKPATAIKTKRRAA